MRCQYCGYLDSRVIDSRPTEEGSSIRRRRECLRCGECQSGLALHHL